MPATYFSTEYGEGRSVPLNPERLINYLTERQLEGAKTQIPLYGAPGLASFANAGQGPCRGGTVANDILYVVNGSNFYRINADSTSDLLGIGIGGTDPVSVANSGPQICIVNGVQGWVYTIATDDFELITDPDFMASNSVIFMDGYFVFNATGTNQWFISGLFNGGDFDSLDFATAEAQSGHVVATCQNLQLLFIFTTSHIELWYDAGTPDFPFQRYAGGVLDYGCVSPDTIVKQDGAIFFLGADRVFYRLQGNTPVIVSTQAIARLIAEDQDVTRAFCTTYVKQQHKCVVLTLPTSNRTVVYDISTGKWHERESCDDAGNPLGRWRGNFTFEAYNKVLVGDAYNGQVGRLDWTVYAEYDNTIPGRIVSPVYHADRKRLFISIFELDVESGVGNASGEGADPQILLRWSRNGGRTWSPLQAPRSIGKQGEYTKRLRWLGLGQARQWVFEVVCTDPVKRVILGAYITSTAGVN